MSHKLDYLEELTQQYIASFGEKIAALNGALDAGDSRRLIQLFHQLAGSGATYGLPQVTEIGRRLENQVKTQGLADIPGLRRGILELEGAVQARLPAAA